jgi:hypothetical protein
MFYKTFGLQTCHLMSKCKRKTMKATATAVRKIKKSEFEKMYF